MSLNRYTEKLENDLDELKSLCRHFLSILEIEEESDSGRKFRPTTINSCRAFDLEVIGHLLKEIKEKSKED